jgi:hypothetical protein
MKTWERTGYMVIEKEFDYDLHEFDITQKGEVIATITPACIEDMEKIIKDLDNEADVNGWEDGNGNTIRINTWGGNRKGSGRPSTGRIKKQIYVTDEEFDEVKKLIEDLRKSPQ